jgi:copper chaperone CopZ
MAVGAMKADTKVEVKNVHLCCGACVKAASKAVQSVEGVTGGADQSAKTVTITAPDDTAAQRALDALAAAGFHGDTGSATLIFKDDSGAPSGKVQKLALTGIHNCCRSCSVAIKEALKKVPGVSSDTAQAKGETFEVSGDFEASALIKALNAAGFHVKVKN